MELTLEGVLGYYVARFDERTRRAHTVALAGAIATVKDRWPTLELVRRVSRIYGVAVEELGAYFGLIRQPGGREVWVDVFRSPESQHLVSDTMTPDQRRAYGTMLAMLEVARPMGWPSYIPSPKCRRDVHGEPLETETRSCLRCSKPFESEGPHNRLCGPCGKIDVSPFAV